MPQCIIIRHFTVLSNTIWQNIIRTVIKFKVHIHIISILFLS